LGDDFAQATPRKPGIDVKEGEYILCVGTIEVRKNHQLLYTAYKLGLSKGLRMPKLVIVGGKGWYTSDVLFEFAHDPQMKDLVYIMHHANDNELKWLYENCKFTIYPSVYEGWGLPVAESLAYGKLCVSSNVSSMPEIAGGLIDYFSPYDSGECLEAIEKYINDENLLKKEAEIKKVYKTNSWDQTFEQTQKILKTFGI
jgi:glycosyltransferase involved in cell wall biosynthesis